MFPLFFDCCIKLSKRLKNPQRKSNVKHFINQYNWKNIPSHKKDWKKFEKKKINCY